mgnify:CR=1 FL=1
MFAEDLSPVVKAENNFDKILIPKNHVSSSLYLPRKEKRYLLPNRGCSAPNSHERSPARNAKQRVP